GSVASAQTHPSSSLTFSADRIPAFARPFAASGKPRRIDGAVPIQDSCDVVYLLIAMVQMRNAAFVSLGGNKVLDHREESCARYQYFATHSVSEADQKNTFKLEEFRKKYLADAQQFINTIISAKILYFPHYGGEDVELKHYSRDTNGFAL